MFKKQSYIRPTCKIRNKSNLMLAQRCPIFYDGTKVDVCMVAVTVNPFTSW